MPERRGTEDLEARLRRNAEAKVLIAIALQNKKLEEEDEEEEEEVLLF
jgi:hypothetical protein